MALQPLDVADGQPECLDPRQSLACLQLGDFTGTGDKEKATEPTTGGCRRRR